MYAIQHTHKPIFIYLYKYSFDAIFLLNSQGFFEDFSYPLKSKSLRLFSNSSGKQYFLRKLTVNRKIPKNFYL